MLTAVERGMRVMIGGSNRLAELTARIVTAIGATHGPCDIAIEHDSDALALCRTCARAAS